VHDVFRLVFTINQPFFKLHSKNELNT